MTTNQAESVLGMSTRVRDAFVPEQGAGGHNNYVAYPEPVADAIHRVT